MHTSIYQYILNCRVNHLADLLLTTDRSLADIATEAGFKDYNNISRIFKSSKDVPLWNIRRKNHEQIKNKLFVFEYSFSFLVPEALLKWHIFVR